MINVNLICHRLRPNFSRTVLKSWAMKICWWLKVSQVCILSTFSHCFSLANRTFVAVFLALQAFQVMHDAACLIDPTTNSYCYLSAVQNTNPSDLYFYSLPLGIPLPNSSKPSCSPCSKNIMGIYAAALSSPTTGKVLGGLKSSYDVSAQVAAQFCGSAFAKIAVSAAVSVFNNGIGMGRTVFFAFGWTIFAYYFSWWYYIPHLPFSLTLENS